MTLKVYTYLLFCAILTLFACKEDNKQNSKQVTTENNVAADQLNPVKKERMEELRKRKEAAPEQLAAQRQQALSILNFRLKGGAKSYAIVEADVWEYQFYYDGEMSKPGEYEGVWIDFKPDHTYEYGKLQTVQGSGRYNYHFERGELLMVDNQQAEKPKEYTVKGGDAVMVLVGTSTYGDNSIQMKLERQPDSFRN